MHQHQDTKMEGTLVIALDLAVGCGALRHARERGMVVPCLRLLLSQYEITMFEYSENKSTLNEGRDKSVSIRVNA